MIYKDVLKAFAFFSRIAVTAVSKVFIQNNIQTNFQVNDYLSLQVPNAVGIQCNRQ